MHIPIALAVGLAAAGSTMAGGALALRFRSLLGLLFGFSSGAIIGVSLLDLMPEAIALQGASGSALVATSAMAFGFVGYLGLDHLGARMFEHRGHLGPGSLAVHSLMDGLGIGLAFQVSSAVGLIVAIAVLAHDVLDGANTVALSVAGGGSVPVARRWLLIDAAAPVLGIGIAQLLKVPDHVLSALLAVFAGGFLYIGANELLPRMRESRAPLRQGAAAVAGLTILLAIVRASSI